MIMIQAGKAVDDFIKQLVWKLKAQSCKLILFLFKKLEYFEPGDIIIDGGNSEYKHTQVE